MKKKRTGRGGGGVPIVYAFLLLFIGLTIGLIMGMMWITHANGTVPTTAHMMEVSGHGSITNTAQQLLRRHSRHRSAAQLPGTDPSNGNQLFKSEADAEANKKALDAIFGHDEQIDTSGKPEFPYLGHAPPSDYNIEASWKPPGGKRFVEYTEGDEPYHITEQLKKQSDDLARSRRKFVKGAMQFAWAGYEKYAFGMDEVMPNSRHGDNNWGGMGTTLVDSLDTLWLMGMKDEFWRARDWVRDHLSNDHVGWVSVFETTIRSLGGLLSAYDWSGDRVFLDKAYDLGKRLIKSFDGSTSGLPTGQVNLRTGQNQNIGWTGGNVILSEFGTLQMEFRYLAHALGTQETLEYAQKTEHVFEILDEMSPPNGLFPYFFRNQGVSKPEFANNHLTFGAMADSIYEYMLKVWIQGGRKEPLYRKMYDKAIDGMHNELLQTSTPSGLVYIADKHGSSIEHKMDHLVCFMGGLLALGAYTDPEGLESKRAQRDLKTARALTYTCYQMYARFPTGISPEFVSFSQNNDFRAGAGAPHYLLRPEAVESFFIMSQLTGDPIYREWGWEVFQSIEKYCKTGVGYGSLGNVEIAEGQQPRNKMESFFLAETLKYLYLLFDPDTEVDVLHKHVFNTEAHPMRVFPVIEQVAAAGH